MRTFNLGLRTLRIDEMADLLGMSEVISLSEFESQFAADAGLADRLDAFGQRSDSQRTNQVDQRLEQRLPRWLAPGRCLERRPCRT